MFSFSDFRPLTWQEGQVYFCGVRYREEDFMIPEEDEVRPVLWASGGPAALTNWSDWSVGGGGAAKPVPAAPGGGEDPRPGEGAGGAHQRPRARVRRRGPSRHRPRLPEGETVSNTSWSCGSDRFAV